MAFVTPTEPDGAASAQGFEELGQLGAVLSIFPDGRDAVSSMDSKIMTEGILDQAVRSLVAALTASKWSDNVGLRRYLADFASHRDMTVDDARALLAEPDWPGLDPAEQALLTYIAKAATEPFKMVERDVEALTAAGWGEREIVEALTVACNAGYLAVANIALGITEGAN